MRIAMLGPLEVRTDSGELLELSGARLRALLIRLAMEPGRVVTQSQLIDALWADDPPAGAANALQALVSRLRRVLPEGTVQSHPAGYRLAIDADAVDILKFEQLIAKAHTDPDAGIQPAEAVLEDALGLWRGPALAEVADAEFARATATRLAELRLRAVEDLAEAELRAGDGRPDIAALEGLVTEHPTRERAVALLMRALVATGRTADALAAYERLRATLAEEFGADPGPDLAAVHLQVLRGELSPPSLTGGPGLVTTPTATIDQVAAAGAVRASRNDAQSTADGLATTASAAAMISRHTNLRAEVTSFIGRDEDVNRVGKLVEESRLTTLTGPGGAGKTRLAVESARMLVDQSPDGVWLAELAPVSAAADVPQAILAALGLRDRTVVPRARVAASGGGLWDDRLDRLAELLDTHAESIDRLAGALADKRLLLVLDNCEHLVDAVAALVDHLLRSCSTVRILATSREPLGITGESLWPVAPLEMPPPETDAAHARAYPAVRLFTDRAAAAYPEFVLNDRTVADVVRVCRALDGMPLAIELAAARLRTMTLDQIACRLDDRFQLLAAGSRTARRGHQTLRAVVDWSWELLDDSERTLLRRLSYFTGGATLEAAEAIMAANSGRRGLGRPGAPPVQPSGGDPLARPADTLETLSRLTDKSLLILDRNGRSRYRLLETIKAYGLEQLAAAGETEQVRRAHAAYFLDLAEAAEPHLRSDDQLRWLGRLDAEHDNLHAALRAAITAGDALTAIRFVAALGWYWNLRAKRTEGFELAVEALRLPGDVPDETRALAYVNGGLCAAFWPLDEGLAQEWFSTALELVDRVDQRAHPMLRLARPMSAMIQNWSAGVSSWTVADDLVADPDPWVRGSALIMRAYSAFYSGADHDQGEQDLYHALSEFRTTGDRSAIAMALGAVAEVDSWRGDFATAAAHTREALALVTELASIEEVAQYRIFLARQLWLLGDEEEARDQLAQAQLSADRIGVREYDIATAVVAADLDRFTGNLESARRRLELAAHVAAELRPVTEHHGLLATAQGYVATAMGDLEAAAAHHRRALKLASSQADALAVSRTLTGIADLTLARGNPDHAAQLLSAGVVARGRVDRSVPDAHRIEAAARAALGDGGFAEAYARGRQVATRQEACDLAAVMLDA